MGSYEWFTKIYFPIASDWNVAQYYRVLSVVGSAGLVVPFESSQWEPYWSPLVLLPGKDKRVANRLELLQLLQKEGGGYVGLASEWPDIRATLFFDPGAKQSVNLVKEFDFGASASANLQTQAEAGYGILHLMVDPRTMLTDLDTRLIPDAVRLIWRASLAMARSVDAVYGLGDFSILSSPTIDRDDLDNRRVPRLAWWNYFGPEYFKRWSEAEWPGGGTWAEHRDEHGWTVIMRPPEGLLHTTNEEHKALFAP